MKTIICIPNHLPNLDHLKSWEEFKSPDVEIIVVQDIGDKPEIPEGFNVTIYDHDDIQQDLGKDAWIIPSKTSACRSYGYYKAWQRKPDLIITLDNDCYPDKHSEGSYITGHLNALYSQTTLDWYPTTTGLMARGFPYTIRGKSEVYLNHGMWSNVPDYDAPTMLLHPSVRFEAHKKHESMTIPRNNFFPMCGMNLAWKAELTPSMYFGLFGPEYGFDQFDDIWAGVLVKKVLDHLGFAAKSGFPSVEHRKQSNAFTNLKKQAPGMQMNENFWKAVRDIQLSPLVKTKYLVSDVSKDSETTYKPGELITQDPETVRMVFEPKEKAEPSDVLNTYEELITKLPDVIDGEPEGWTKKFKEAALIWVNLFK